MSSKSSQGPKKVNLPQPPTPPRFLPEIQAEYQQTALQAGQAQYQVYVHKLDAENLNKKLLDLNREAAERNRLDSEAAKQKEGSNE